MPEERKRKDELSIKVVQLSQNAITSFFVKEKFQIPEIFVFFYNVVKFA